MPPKTMGEGPGGQVGGRIKGVVQVGTYDDGGGWWGDIVVWGGYTVGNSQQLAIV